jgi:NAD(P)-dependent dehydrogenase (short-subunit alcohol dehydrogenase family)
VDVGKLDGKVVIVTGAGSGLGRGIACGLAREGATVVLAARRAANLEETAALIAAADGQSLVVPTDVREAAQVEALFTTTMSQLGRLDVLVNNAGLAGPAHAGPVDEMSIEIWDNVIAVNLRAPFLCAQQALRIMKKQGSGRIINIGSISAQRVRPDNCAYNASKFGIDGLTHTIALEGRPYGISCGALHPGNTRAEHNPDIAEATVGPDDMAQVAVLMATLPPELNLFQAICLPVDQLYVGRG